MVLQAKNNFPFFSNCVTRSTYKRFECATARESAVEQVNWKDDNCKNRCNITAAAASHCGTAYHGVTYITKYERNINWFGCGVRCAAAIISMSNLALPFNVTHQPTNELLIKRSSIHASRGPHIFLNSAYTYGTVCTHLFKLNCPSAIHTVPTVAKYVLLPARTMRIKDH